MIIEIWTNYLYQPLFNALIWMYNNWTDANLGWAVVYLTLILRTALLPLTIISEKNKIKNQAVFEEVEKLGKDFQNDPVLAKEEIRRRLKERRVQPWAKSVSLAIQGVVLILLYQVFLRGVTGEKILKILYPSIDFPGVINTMFYGFDLAARYDWIAAGIVALWLAGDIYFSYYRKKEANRADLAYFVLFPLSVFIFLWILPMVKSLFVFTSILFSFVIRQILKIFIRPKKDNDNDEKPRKDDKKQKKKEWQQENQNGKVGRQIT